MAKSEVFRLLSFSLVGLSVISGLQACGSGGGVKNRPIAQTPAPGPAPTPAPAPAPTPSPLADIGVAVNLNMKHEVGGISTLDRSKFITIHSSITDKDWGNSSFSTGLSAEDAQLRNAFFEDNDVYLGRNNGGMPWRLDRLRNSATEGRISLTQSKAFGEQDKINFYVNGYNQDSESYEMLEGRAANMMQGGQLSMYPQNELNLPCSQESCNNTNEWLEGFDALADYYVSYLSDYYGEGGTTGEPKPKYIEVVNEPMLFTAKYRTTPQGISDMHSVVAKRIKAVHPDVNVGGYTAAWPALEERDFATFDERWKVFIDTAGEDMDFYSIHFYDSYRGNKRAYRSGANMEAILDMLDQYSILKVGEQKPWVVSEYGYFTPNVIERASIQNVGYSKELDWLNVRSFSSMLMGFLERPDQMVSSIPFHLNKALWYHSGSGGVGPDGKRYGPRLFIMEEELNGDLNVTDNPDANWIYSDLLKWYQLWSEVKGTRVDTHSTEIDIQVDGYVDGNTLYLVLNNLEHENKEVELSMVENHGLSISEVSSKHLYWDDGEQSSVLHSESLPASTKVVEIAAEATRILKITYSGDINVDQQSLETKYFANAPSSFRQAITASQPVTFELNGVDTSSAEGEAILRVGVGRQHGLSLTPTVSINGVTLPEITDVRGYYENQARDNFFGVLEIPVSYSDLQTDNDIVVQFPDSGGTVSTVTMQVFNMSAKPSRLGR